MQGKILHVLTLCTWLCACVCTCAHAYDYCTNFPTHGNQNLRNVRRGWVRGGRGGGGGGGCVNLFTVVVT